VFGTTLGSGDDEGAVKCISKTKSRSWELFRTAVRDVTGFEHRSTCIEYGLENIPRREKIVSEAAMS
jgi:hypothetical protein